MLNVLVAIYPLAIVLPFNNATMDQPQIFDGIGYQPPMSPDEEAFEQLQKLLVTPDISDVGSQLQAIQQQLQELTPIASQPTGAVTTQEISKLKQDLAREMATQSAMVTGQLKQLRNSLKELTPIASDPPPDTLAIAEQTLGRLKTLEQQLQSLQQLPQQLERLQQLIATAKYQETQDKPNIPPLDPKAFIKLLIPILGELFNRKFQQFTHGFNDGSIKAIEACLEAKLNTFSERQTMLLKQEFSSIYRQIDQLDAKVNYLSSYLEPRSKDI